MNRRTILTVRLVIMLAVMTILCAAPLFAFAEEYDHVEEQYSYSLIKNSDASDTYTLRVGKGTDESIEYLSLYNTDIWNNYRDRITQVYIEGDFKQLSNACFYKYTNLKKVELPSGLEKIGSQAFQGCIVLDDMEIPSTVKTMGNNALFRCGSNPTILVPSHITGLTRAKACYNSMAIVEPEAPEGTTSEQQFEETYTEITKVLNTLDLDGRSDYDKLLKIYEWVTANVTYDDEGWSYRNSEDNSKRALYYRACRAHSAIMRRLAVCSGFVDLTRIMLNEAGLRCVSISGNIGTESHEWLIVLIGGKWYRIDPTWDAHFEPEDYMNFLVSRQNMIDKGYPWEEGNEIFQSVYPISTTDFGTDLIDGYTVRFRNGKALLKKYTGKETAVTLPESIEFEGTTYSFSTVSKEVFSRSSITSIVIPEGYEHIGESAFVDCGKLKEVTLPVSLKEIDNCAFDSDSPMKIIYAGTKEQFKEIKLGEEPFCFDLKSVICNDGEYVIPFNLMNCRLKVKSETFVYNGKNQIPEITVTDIEGNVLKSGTDYTVEINDDTDCRSKKVDMYSVKIEGTGKYYGILDTGKYYDYRIIPQAVKLKSAKAGKRSLKAFWTKKTQEVKGYQVQCALNSKFTKGKKTVKIKSNKTVSAVIKKLKSKKTYYVRVRTYKAGPEYGETLYSKWSNVRKVKVR